MNIITRIVCGLDLSSEERLFFFFFTTHLRNRASLCLSNMTETCGADPNCVEALSALKAHGVTYGDTTVSP